MRDLRLNLPQDSARLSKIARLEGVDPLDHSLEPRTGVVVEITGKYRHLKRTTDIVDPALEVRHRARERILGLSMDLSVAGRIFDKG